MSRRANGLLALNTGVAVVPVSTIRESRWLPDFRTTLTTMPRWFAHTSAARLLLTRLNSATASGEGLTTTFSAPTEALASPPETSRLLQPDRH